MGHGYSHLEARVLRPLADHLHVQGRLDGVRTAHYTAATFRAVARVIRALVALVVPLLLQHHRRGTAGHTHVDHQL